MYDFTLKKMVLFLCLVLSALFLYLPPVEARDDFVKRKILALYDSRYHDDTAETNIHKFAEMPLNFMGLDVRYHDINKGLPEIKTLSGYRGVITWFGRHVSSPGTYLVWADEAMNAGLKFALVGNIGVDINPRTLPHVNRLLLHLGLEFDNRYVSQPRGTTLLKMDKTFVGFERPVYDVFPSYNIFKSVSPAVRVHLSVRPPLEYRNPEAVLVATHKSGGFVHSGFGIFYDERVNTTKWILNPFTFFERVFGEAFFPVPDVTTLAGRRMYFSHIDGDGWNNISYIEHYKKTKTIAAEVVLKEFIQPYPDLPVSFALVTGDCDADLGGDPAACDRLARKLFALPQVEVASHTHTHPFKWEFFRSYNRKAELALIEKHQPKEKMGLMARVSRYMAKFSGKISARELNKYYIAGSSRLPRAFLKRPYRLDLEITRSLKIVEKYAPPGKKARLLQWSGNTRPGPAHIRATRKAGVYNMNGGDNRYDSQYPSVSYVQGISRVVGGERQIYAANSNENTYTNDWTGPFYGFLKLTETVKNTEYPRRLKPFNVYYHSYSGERDAALNAVKTHLDAARKTSVIPVPASLYCAIATGFFTVKIKKTGPLQWSFHDRGALQTIRFDKAGKLGVDWDRSSGILGMNRHAGSAYIALDPAVRVPVLVLARKTGIHNTQKKPVLEDSRWRIRKLAGNSDGFSFRATGFGPGNMHWRVIKPGASCQVMALRKGKILWQKKRLADKKGHLGVNIRTNAIKPLDVRISCL